MPLFFRLFAPPRGRHAALLLALALSGGAQADTRSACALVDWRVEDARMQRLEATPSSAGCRIDGVAPTADIARLQQRVLALVAEANCAAVASPGAVDGNARTGYGFTLTLAPPAGGGVCLQPPETPPAEPQAGVDMQSRHELPPVPPDTARAAGQHGVAMVVVLVDADEVPVASLIARSTGVPALDAAALEASQRWTYGRHEMPRAPGIGLVRVPVPFDAD